MRQLIFLLMLMGSSHFSLAQVTIVRIFPNDTIDLNCAGCTTQITALALVKGQQSIPINLEKPVARNLLHWEYYDDISKEKVIMADRPLWADGTQLVDMEPEEAIISWHINLLFTDSLQRQYQFFLVLSGVNRQELRTLPLETTFDPDTYAIFRFSAIAQRTNPETLQKETYDCMDGTCIIEKMDTKSKLLEGTFSFTGNRVGLEHKIVFLNGRIKN